MFWQAGFIASAHNARRQREGEPVQMHALEWRRDRPGHGKTVCGQGWGKEIIVTIGVTLLDELCRECRRIVKANVVVEEGDSQ